MPILGLITRFVLAGVIGLGGALGVAAVSAPPASSLLPGPDTAFELTTDTGDELAVFGLTAVPDQEPVTLRALPDDAVLQLVSFLEPGTEPGSGGASRPAWLLPTGYPRVPPVSQFDGGPLGPANCTMASGAMLARLGYGIVTTGSQLRALQPDQVGGTSIADLQVAIATWGVSFSQGAISPLQLRALLYAGAGAVVQVAYGAIPAALRLQADFTGGHAIYLDGFRPAGTDGPAGYFVIDPLGPTWTGYRGAWWPADVVEAAALAFGGGTAYTAWAFPGGAAPRNPPPLPPSAFPQATSAPGVTPNPLATATPIPSPPPLPTPDATLGAPPVGDTPPVVPPDWWIPTWTGLFEGGKVLSPVWTACIVDPAPWCPDGIIGIWPPEVAAPPTLPPFQVSAVDLLFANPIGGGLMQVIFDIPEGATPFLQFWDAAAATGPLMSAPSIEAAILDGRTVQVATFPIQQGIDYNFVASARSLGVSAISDVGTAGP